MFVTEQKKKTNTIPYEGMSPASRNEDDIKG